MASPSTTEAALKLEIERLTGAIQQAKTGHPSSDGLRHRSAYNNTGSTFARSNTYVNPSYKPPTRGKPPTTTFKSTTSRPLTTDLSRKKDVTIGGVAFESSGRSLVRKDVAKAQSLIKPTATKPLPPHPRSTYASTAGDHRPYKPRGSRGRSLRPTARNMSLNNQRRPFQSRKAANKRKYLDKPCPRFTTTGSCTRGLTCPYQHDPEKIAICWKFLQGTCPNDAQTCNLSHDPKPERTPLCVHFANNGRCNRDGCPFPHVRVGAREGVCRDFAVLGYCAKGLDCEHQHVRECPDFAEKGECTTRGCKLPHVIRANRGRKAQSVTTSPPITGAATSARAAAVGANDSNPTTKAGTAATTRYFAEDAKLGDEYISLTFHESEESEGEDGEDEDEDEDVSEDEDETGMDSRGQQPARTDEF